MKAIRVSNFGGPEVLKLEDIPALIPSPGQILVRLHAAGVNPVDTYIRGGKYAQVPPLPFTPGIDGAGVIEKSTVPSLSEGSRVYVAASLTGTYAVQALCTPGQIYPLPDHISFDQGAAIGVPYGTAVWALFNRGQARFGETLLVHGASGGVGLAAVQLGHAAGLRVFGTAGTPEGLELVLKQGAAAAFNHRDPDYREQIKAATGGRGVDLILEMLANQNLGHDLTLLARHGRVVVIGSRGPVEIDARNIMAREADIRGVALLNVTDEQLAGMHGRVAFGLANHSLNPVVGHAIPLAEAPRAHEQIIASGARGKIVLTM